MPSITSNVVVTIQIKDGEKAASQAEDIGKRGQAAFSGWSDALATVQKALLSMGGVLAAWTVFITIPEKLASGFKELAIASVEAAAQMEKSMITTAAVLSSALKFGDSKNSAENFKAAYAESEKLAFKFQEISAKSLASASELNIAYRTLVAEGGMHFVHNQEEALRVTKLLVDAIVALGGGQDDERKITSDIAQLMQGTARTGNLVGKEIESVVGNLKLWVTHFRETKDMAEQLEKILHGYKEAGAPLSQTMEAVTNTIKGQIDLLNDFANRGGALIEVIRWLQQVRDMLRAAINDLGQLGDKTHVLSANTLDVVKVFGNLQASIREVLYMFETMIVSVTGGNTQLKQSVTISNALLTVMTYLRTIVDFVFDRLGLLGDMAKLVFDSWITRAMKVYQIFPTIIDALGSYLDAWGMKAGKTLMNVAADLKTTLSTVQKDYQKGADDAANAVWKKLDQMSGHASFSDQLKINLRQAQDDVRISSAAIILSITNIMKAAEKAKKPIAEILMPTKEQLSFFDELGRKMDNSIASLQAQEGNIFAEADKNFLEMREKIKKDLADQPSLQGPANMRNETTYNNAQNLVIEKELLQIQKARLQELTEELKGLLKLEVERLENIRLNRLDVESMKESILTQKELIATSDEFLNKVKAIGQQLRDDAENGSVNWAKAWKDYGDAVKGADKQIQELETRNKFLRKQLATNRDEKQHAEFGAELEVNLKKIDDTKQHLAELLKIIRDLANSFDPATAAWKRFTAAVLSGNVAIKDVKDAVLGLTGAMAGALGAALSGQQSFLAAFRSAIAEEIRVLGVQVIAHGISDIAQSGWPPNPARLAVGAKEIAAGAAIVELSRLIGGSGNTGSAGSASATGASAAGGTRTIYMNPEGVNNTSQNSMHTAIIGLNNTISNFQTQPPGVVVKAATGDASTMHVVTKAINTTLQGSTSLTTSMRKTVLGTT
jgi:hypothetical protein